ncbi:hypothetical protein MLD38_019720 [Melastoma candidum]|uniref:Uncharacterized protein n=1 Tax=Melastoma candidum TaxID=119954 RepID=A0ACB9QZ62_9MYRT|nr:hypothetical protein MLD38_019720 [Melastoma candidum]
MGREIVELEMEEERGEGIGNPRTRESNSGDEEEGKKVEIVLRTIGPARPTRLLIPSPLKVSYLREIVAEKSRLSVQNLKLVYRGNVLHDKKGGDDSHVDFTDGDSLIVAVKPKAPVRQHRDGLDSDDEDDLEFQLPQTASWWKRKLFQLLHDKLKLPDILLMAVFSLSLKTWGLIILWFVMAPVAHKWDVGPLYILATGFCIILLNLGRRQPGDLSAYSIFNEGFRELPGTLNADRLDRDMRTGQI